MRQIIVAGLLAFAVLTVPAITYAERFENDDYIIDASNIGSSMSGLAENADYSLVSSGGETFNGTGSNGSYQLDSGYVAQLVDDAPDAIEIGAQPASPLLYLPFSEGSGASTFDRSVNGYEGVVSGATWAPGQVGGALSFDGVDDVVTISQPDPNSWEPLGDNFTLSSWFKTAASSTQHIAGSQFTDSGDRYHISIGTSGRVNFFFTTGSGSCNTTSPASGPFYNNDEWHHIVGVRTGLRTCDLYVNGALVDSDTDNSGATGSIDTEGSDFRIGSRGGGVDYFTGEIDEVKMLNKQMTAREIEAEYEAGVLGIAAGIAFPDGINPGIPQSTAAEIIVETTAADYTLAISQNNNLSDGSNTISSVDNGGTISSPAVWSDGTTQGLGFTIADGSSVDPKWGSGPFSYAELPSSATAFHSRSGYTPNSRERTEVSFRLDVASEQPAGLYTNQVTFVGTIIP